MTGRNPAIVNECEVGVSDQEMNCELFVFLIEFVNRK